MRSEGRYSANNAGLGTVASWWRTLKRLTVGDIEMSIEALSEK
jgi:hypothetical protein